jgi:hypothetical protein
MLRPSSSPGGQGWCAPMGSSRLMRTRNAPRRCRNKLDNTVCIVELSGVVGQTLLPRCYFVLCARSRYRRQKGIADKIHEHDSTSSYARFIAEAGSCPMLFSRRRISPVPRNPRPVRPPTHVYRTPPVDHWTAVGDTRHAISRDILLFEQLAEVLTYLVVEQLCSAGGRCTTGHVDVVGWRFRTDRPAPVSWTLPPCPPC